MLEKAKIKEEDSSLYYELQEAFKEVKLMKEGRKEKKSLDDLINELRNTNN